MKNYTIDITVAATHTSLEIISLENVLVTLKPGCLWSFILKDGVQIGIAFEGPVEFAVDAITETSEGALGQSFAGTLKGIQFYFGNVSEIDNISRTVSQEELANLNYSDPDAFTSAAKEDFEKLTDDDKSINISEEPDGQILIGRDEKGETLILVIKEDNLVFTYGTKVFVLSDDGFVSVGEDGIAVSSSDGKEILIGRDGLIDLTRLGPSTSHKVATALGGRSVLKKLKRLKHVQRRTIHGDNMDDLDWDD